MKKLTKKLFLIGPMGAGKTSVGRFLAKQLQCDFYDSDEEIEKRTGVNLTWLYDIEGESGFQEREIKVLDELTSLSSIILSTGGGSVEIPEVCELLRSRGSIIYLQVSLATQLDRLKHDKKRPSLQGTEDPEAVLVRLWPHREQLYQKLADFSVMTDNRSVRDVCKDILAWLGIES